MIFHYKPSILGVPHGHGTPHITDGLHANCGRIGGLIFVCWGAASLLGLPGPSERWAWGKSWENPGKMGKSWENHGKMMGKSWENGKIMGKPWKNHPPGGTSLENHWKITGKITGKSLGRFMVIS